MTAVSPIRQTPTSHAADDSQRPMRIAYIMSRFPKISETFVFREINAVKQRGVDVEIFPLIRERTSVVHPEVSHLVETARFTPLLSMPILASNLSNFVRRPIKYLGVFFDTLRATWGSRRFLGGAIAYYPKAVYFADQMQRLEIDHVHAHFASFPAAVAYVIYRFTNIPFSFTAHGSDLHRDRRMLREKVEACAFAVSISECNRQLILSECGAKIAHKLVVVHCGIDSDFFHARDEPTVYDLRQGPLKLVCTGTLHEVKGQIYLLRACQVLQEREVDFHCHLIGDGPDRELLAREARDLRIEQNVTFHGACTAEQVRQHVSDADIYICPSVPSRDGRREGIPVALMEAMACSVPCIASRLSGIPELVRHEDTGFLTEPSDHAAIAQSIARLASDHRLRRELGEAGRRFVRANFELGDNVEKLIEHFKNTVQANA